MSSKLSDMTEASSFTQSSWHTNTVVEYAKYSMSQQDMTGSLLTKVLIIYCGGTIGMKNEPIHGYYPVSGYMAHFLSQNPSFNDIAFQAFLRDMNRHEVNDIDISSMRESIGPILVTPTSFFGKRIAYQILEYDPLKDSCNMSMDDWIKIASDIETYYHDYDSFVVLHGTDTMAYTVSALSFLLENLGKTVIFTGSQIPFCEVRNDAKDNLLGALTIAGHFSIPEVCLFFGNKLYRGNRVSKTNATDFEAFDSPNLKPLAKMGVNIDIEWSEVLRPTEVKQFHAHKRLDPNVGALRFFPGITLSSIKAFFSEPIRGVVLETFGTGNAPDNRPEIMKEIADAVNRGIIIVNITQCKKGSVSDIYSTGRALFTAGVVPGRDMTPECALTKLSYLLSLDKYDPATIRTLMSEPLRGELTSPITFKCEDHGKASSSWLYSVYRSALLASTSSIYPEVSKTLSSMFLHKAAAKGDINALLGLVSKGTNIDLLDDEGRTALHVAVACQQLDAVSWLITHSANVHSRDHFNRSIV